MIKFPLNFDRKPGLVAFIEVQDFLESLPNFKLLLGQENRIEFELKEQYPNISIEDIYDKVSSEIHIYLFYSGHGIIKQSIQNQQDPTDQINMMLPGEDHNEFVWCAEVNGSVWDVSIARRTSVVEIIDRFFERYTIKGILIGYSFLYRSGNLIPDGDYTIDRFKIAKYRQAFEIKYDKEIISTLESIQIAGETIDTKVLPLYLASRLLYDKPEQVIVGTLNTLVPVDNSHNKSTSRKNAIGLISLISLFCLLLANMFIINSVRSKNQQYRNAFVEKKQFLQELDSIQDIHDSQSELLADAGMKEHTCFAIYADLIAALVPEQIILTELVLAPKTKESENQNILTFQNGMAIIRGQTAHPLWLNEFVGSLKEQNWVTSVAIDYFSAGSSRNTLPEFKITLMFVEDEESK